VPDGATKKALDAGVSEAKALFAARYGAGFLAFFEGTHWMAPTLPEVVEASRPTRPIRTNTPSTGAALLYCPQEAWRRPSTSPGHTYALKQSSQGT
jgi:hypothetical protein